MLEEIILFYFVAKNYILKKLYFMPICIYFAW